jgi:drug/metabolite transporter (DMT)-like permease
MSSINGVTGMSIAGAVVTWIAMAELLQDIQKTYRKPMFISYAIRCSYTLCLLALAPRVLKSGRNVKSEPLDESMPLNEKQKQKGDSKEVSEDTPQPSLIVPEISPRFPRPVLMKLIGWMVALAWMSMFGAYCWYMSLNYTTVPVNTIVYQLNCVFVFIINVCFGERLSWEKLGAVLICTAGTAIVVMSKGGRASSSASNTSGGIALVLSSTVTYAIYEWSYERFAAAIYARGVQKHPMSDPFVFLGLLGAASAITCWPLLIILDRSGIEQFELPPDWHTAGVIVENGLLDTGFNGFLVLGIAHSSALVMAAGTQFVVPLSYVVDASMHNFKPNAGSMGGAVVLVAGFLLLTKLRAEGRGWQ